MLRIGVLASHQGTNFQAIVNACEQNIVQANVALLICNNSAAPVLARARKSGVPTVHLSSLTHPSASALDESMNDHLINENIDLVVLAGYMKKLGSRVLEAHRDRIINVHPSLLPRHGGPGFMARESTRQSSSLAIVKLALLFIWSITTMTWAKRYCRRKLASISMIPLTALQRDCALLNISY